MTEMPEDLMMHADRLYDEGGHKIVPQIIAEAILAERERCAAILREWVELFGSIEIHHTSAREYALGAIEDALEHIESGSTGELRMIEEVE